MNLVVVVKSGENQSITLSSIRFDKYGSQTNQPIIVCEQWVQGFESAKIQGYSHAMFVDSGTVFFDWPTWVKELDEYPHRGLIAHIIHYPGSEPCMHEQCWFMDLSLFDASSWTETDLTYASPIRSQDNIHDDYTPLYLRPGPEDQKQHYIAENFGQSLIAHHLNNGRAVVNWSQKIRQHKMYMYSNEPTQRSAWHQAMANYTTLAEEQFWVLNNEPVKLLLGKNLLMPAAGIYWLANLVQPTTQSISLVDISRRQIAFANHLWQNWDGIDYGSFAWDYVAANNLIHIEYDVADLDPMLRLKLKNKKRFVEYVNNKVRTAFDQLGIDDFPARWSNRHRVQFSATVGDIVHWVVSGNAKSIDATWMSNVLDYKWTMLNNSTEQINECITRLEQHGIKVL